MEPNMTLRQGLIQFRHAYRDHLSHEKPNISKEAKAFFASHDIAHVLFGCDTSLYGEGAVKIWTIFGTTLGFWRHIRGYKDANAFELSKDFPFVHIMHNIFTLIITIPRIIFRAKQMVKPWNWTDFEPYLDIPISEIRKKYNIKVLR
ncbi:MAG: hypothetical protein AAF206_06945 [Bacteroidota bacterium]